MERPSPSSQPAGATSSDAGPRNGFVDVHAHVAVAEALAEMYRLAPHAVPHVVEGADGWRLTRPGATESSPLTSGLVDVDTRLRDMDAQGVQYQALAPWTSLYLYHAEAALAADLVRLHNDAIVGLARRYPNRFVAIGGLPLQDAGLAVREVERLAPIPEIVAVQIATVVEGRNLDDESLEPVWAALDAAGISVLVHPYGPGNTAMTRLARYYLSNLIGNPLETAIAMASLAFSGVAVRYPRLRFGFVHGGGYGPYQLGRWDHGWQVRSEPKARIDKPPSGYVESWYFDQMTHEPRALAFLAERVGWSQIVIGTDYPWDMGPTRPLRDLTAAGAGPAEVRQVGADNPRTFLRWPAGRSGDALTS